MDKEIITGEVIAKANHYMAVPDKANGGRRIIKDDVLRNYEKNFVRQCKVYKSRLINKPFKIIIDCYYSSSRFDLDNSLKTILDCLQYCKAITDDNLCQAIEARKHINKLNPRVEFSIIELEPRLFG